MTDPARKPDNVPNPTPAPDLPPDITKSVTDLGFNPLEINFFLEGEKIMTEVAKAVEAAPTPEEAGRWERLKNYFKEILGLGKQEIFKARSEIIELKEKGVAGGGEPPAPLNANERKMADVILEKISKAEKDRFKIALGGSRGDQMAALGSIYEALAAEAEKKENKPVDQDELYKKLLKVRVKEKNEKTGKDEMVSAKFVVDKATGKQYYTGMTDEENARLAELEGRDITEADFNLMVTGKKDWSLNALSMAMNMLRHNILPGESETERSHREAEANKPENKIIDEYFAFTDVPGLTQEQKTQLVDNARKAPGNADRAHAMDRMIKTHSKEDVEKRGAMAKAWLESLLKKLNINPSKFSQSKSWAFQDMAMQYHFFEHPDLIGADDFAADPMVSEQKLEEIISRHLGWELYWQKTQKNNAAPLEELETDETYPEIVKLLEQAPEKTGMLSDRDLARLGQLVRKNIREHSIEEFGRVRSDLTITQAEANLTNASNELESLRDDIEIVHEIEDSFTPAARLLKIEDNLAMLGERANMSADQIQQIKNLDQTGDAIVKNKALEKVYQTAVEMMTEEEDVAEKRVQAAKADLSAAKERLAAEKEDEERRKKAAPNAKVIPINGNKSPDTTSDVEKEARIDEIMTRAHAYIGTEAQVKKLEVLDETQLEVKKIDLEGTDLDKLRGAILGEAGTGLTLEDAQLLGEEDIKILAKELLDKINEAPDVRKAKAKPNTTKPASDPAKPAPIPTKPAADPAEPNVKNVDTRSDEEKILVKKILVDVDKKIAQAQKKALTNLDKQDVDELKNNLKKFNEVSDVDSFKKLLVEAKYLTEEEINGLELNKLPNNEMDLIREQIVRDIDRVLFVKNSTAKSATKKAPAAAVPDAKGEKEAVAKTMTEARDKIKTIASKLDEKEIDDLEAEEAMLEEIKPENLKNSMIKTGFLSAEQASRLSRDDIFMLRYEQVAAYKKAINKKKGTDKTAAVEPKDEPAKKEPKEKTKFDLLVEKAKIAVDGLKKEGLARIAELDNDNDLVFAIEQLNRTIDKVDVKKGVTKEQLIDRLAELGILAKEELGELNDRRLKNLAIIRIDQLTAVKEEAKKRRKDIEANPPSSPAAPTVKVTPTGVKATKSTIAPPVVIPVAVPTPSEPAPASEPAPDISNKSTTNPEAITTKNEVTIEKTKSILNKTQRDLFTKIEKDIQSGLAKDKATPEQLEVMKTVHALFKSEYGKTQNLGVKIGLMQKYSKLLKEELANLPK